MKQKISKRAEYWQEQVKRGAEHPGGIRSYCEANGLRRQAFYYWKNKLGTQGVSGPAVKPFSRVEILPAASCAVKRGRLPDPSWLAQFLLALSAGGGQ